MDKIWDNGFRQTTSSTKPINGPDDFKGFKIRVPVSPLWTSMFKAFDAAPASINFSEVYSALQTKIVEGQENPLALISTAKLYEVQKYCSLTNHMWDGFWFLANRRAWEALPEDVRAIVASNINAAGAEGARRYREAQRHLRGELAAKGLVFNQPDVGAVPRQAALGRLLCGVEGQIRRAGLGAAGESPSASCPERPRAGATLDGSRRDSGRRRPARRRRPSPRVRVAGRSKPALGAAGRNPGGAAGGRRDRHPVRRRGRALRACTAR